MLYVYDTVATHKNNQKSINEISIAEIEERRTTFSPRHS